MATHGGANIDMPVYYYLLSHNIHNLENPFSRIGITCLAEADFLWVVEIRQ